LDDPLLVNRHPTYSTLGLLASQQTEATKILDRTIGERMNGDSGSPRRDQVLAFPKSSVLNGLCFF
jgi:hypothetical protein